ncbi:MAG TPA: hypothetical protein VK358_11395 [Longimicrobium sp.]|nr:hypothetical protein [Longimicrobium sp.]
MAYLTLDHVQIAMPAGEEDAARAFYGGELRLEEVPKPEPMMANGGAWFRSGGVELPLGAEADFEPARKAHPGLRVDDLDAHAQAWPMVLDQLAARLAETTDDAPP